MSIDLSFCHFQAVAHLPEHQRLALLEQSVANKWTITQLIAAKKKLQQSKAIPGAQPEQQKDEELELHTARVPRKQQDWLA